MASFCIIHGYFLQGASPSAVNPFAHPVAMLLFRIALRMLQQPEDEQDVSTIRKALLQVIEASDCDSQRENIPCLLSLPLPCFPLW
jgi:hypothetical protein